MLRSEVSPPRRGLLSERLKHRFLYNDSQSRATMNTAKIKQLAVRGLRQVLGLLNIDPALIKAIIRTPPAVHGGPRARRWPWPRRRHFDKREKRAVVQLLNREIRKGGAVIYGGPETKAYCRAFADYLGGGYAAAVNSGTNAVYVALRALDLEPGSEVIVPAITDAGGAMPVALLNCIPVPADCERGSLNTSAHQIREALTDRTAAIVLAHLTGHPVDLDPILALAADRHIPVIEDCAQAHGASYKGRLVGTFGAISAFSTMFGKHHATGAQGGVVFTRDTLLFARARQLIDRGKPFGTLGNPTNVIASLNFNQDEISMAIGRVQLEKLPGALRARRNFAALVARGVKDVKGVSLVGDAPDCSGAYWFLALFVDRTDLNCNSQQFAAALELEGIGGVQAGYPFIPTDQPWHRDAVVFGRSGMPWSLRQQLRPQHFELPNAHEANQAIVRVDLHEALGPDEARDLVAAVKKIAHYYGTSKRSTVGVDAEETLSSTA
jgi:dTDP-4-amino-4,6-dideoxygalactose transaminase